ncbi:MAG: dTDP-4-keto-6-deoxy-D-glucose epimerase [Methylocystaceae bacterium]|nr:dTDP-4-keto-6-deoxy-D-glucose epimerase [Methylocystaceae bacterium]
MFENLEIEGLKLVTPKKFGDERGFFCETYNASTWMKAGLNYNFVQDNHSLSRDVGTVRGLHFQSPPFAQDKLVRVLRGRILDIAVDFVTLEPDTEVCYKVTNFYSTAHDHGVLWDDPDIAIDWPIKKSDAILSQKDKNLPPLSSLENLFP